MPLCLIAQKAPGITTSSFSGNTTWALNIVAITHFHTSVTKHVFSISNLTSDLSLFMFVLRELKMQCNAMLGLQSSAHSHFWQTSQIRFQDVGHPPCSPHRGQLAASLPVLELPAGRLAGFHSVKINNDDIFLFPNKTPS